MAWSALGIVSALGLGSEDESNGNRRNIGAADQAFSHTRGGNLAVCVALMIDAAIDSVTKKRANPNRNRASTGSSARCVVKRSNW